MLPSYSITCMLSQHEQPLLKSSPSHQHDSDSTILLYSLLSLHVSSTSPP